MAHVADEVAQVVLHDAAARHVRGRRDDVDSVHLVRLAGADERKGVDVGAWEARLELLREHDAYRVLAVAVRGDEERRAQLFEDFPTEAERVAQRDLYAGNVEREVEAQLPRHIRQVLLRADEAVGPYLRGELFKLRYFVFGEYMMVAVGPPLGDRDAQFVEELIKSAGVADCGERDVFALRHKAFVLDRAFTAAGLARYPRLELYVRDEDSVLRHVGRDFFLDFLNRSGLRLVRLRQHDDVRAAEGRHRLAHRARRYDLPVAEGTGRVDEDDVHVAPHLPVLEGVVGDGDLRAERGEQLDALYPLARDDDLRVGQAAREHERLVAREVAARAFFVLPYPERRVFLRPVAAAYEARLYPGLGELTHDVLGHRRLVGPAEAVVPDAHDGEHRVGDGEYPALIESYPQPHPRARHELAGPKEAPYRGASLAARVFKIAAKYPRHFSIPSLYARRP